MSPLNNKNINNENYDDITHKKRAFLSSYIIRDILIWLVFLVLIPLVLFGVYYFTKESHTTINAVSSKVYINNSRNISDYDDQINTKTSFIDIQTFESTIVDKLPEAITEPTQDDELKSLINDFDSQNRPLKRISLKNYENSLCNDGSIANYYLRLSRSNSNIWIILLEGGYFCYDTNTCKQRMINSNNLTSSLGSRLYKTGKGILSSSSTENKYWSDVNAV